MFMSILAAERQQQILDRLDRDGRVLAASLAEAFGASEETIRRCLRDLAGLRRALAALVAPDSLLFVDSGSTNLAAVKALPEDLRLTVATHDPAIAAALLAKPKVTLWLIGGRVDARIGAALGGRTLADVEALRPELALLGVCALDPLGGIAAFDPEDAEIKRALLRNSSRVAAAILNEKLETSAPFVLGPAESLDRVVLEADAPEPIARAFADRGMTVLRAEPPEAD